MHNTLNNGVGFRSLNIIDDHNRECLGITMDSSLSSNRVIRELEQLIAWRGKPARIRVDNGLEFIANALQEWARETGIEIHFIQKGKPYQNGYMERFNRSFREEVLDGYCFDRIREAQLMAHGWQWMYNNERPHSSLGYRTPVAFLEERRKGLEAFPTFFHTPELDWKTLVLNVHT